MNRVVVTAHARLHLGFLDLHGGLGRRFGSIGLSLDQPCTSIAIEAAPSDLFSGRERERARKICAAMCAAHGLAGGHRLTAESAIPAHVGLGSGTQLALAVAAATRRLHGLPQDSRADALLLQRGARSGIGAALFETGGVVVDGGQGVVPGVPPVLARHAFPDAWRIILLLDPAMEGVHGQAERDAFAALPQFPAGASAEICRLVLIQALPALIEADIAAFGAAITRMQTLLGDHFAPAQGGRFASPRVARALAALRDAGAAGIGQSSWGPAGFAFAASERQARDLVVAVALAAQGLDVLICSGRNAPATTTIMPGLYP